MTVSFVIVLTLPGTALPSASCACSSSSMRAICAGSIACSRRDATWPASAGTGGAPDQLHGARLRVDQHRIDGQAPDEQLVVLVCQQQAHHLLGQGEAQHRVAARVDAGRAMVVAAQIGQGELLQSRQVRTLLVGRRAAVPVGEIEVFRQGRDFIGIPFCP